LNKYSSRFGANFVAIFQEDIAGHSVTWIKTVRGETLDVLEKMDTGEDHWTHVYNMNLWTDFDRRESDEELQLRLRENYVDLCEGF